MELTHNKGIIQHDILESRIRPAIVLSTSTGNLDVGHIPELLQTFSRVDDVYSAAFHDSLVIQTAPGTNLDLTGLRTRIGNDDSVKSMFRRILGSYATNVTKLLPSGPYFLQGQNIHQAWRLYPDDLQAFIQTVIPDDIICPSRYTSLHVAVYLILILRFSFFPLQAISQDGVYQTAAVPSRLYSEKSKDKPLSGMRITIKDNMDLAGIKSTMMNRAYTELYGPRTKSAAIVRKLIALGAIIIGKTRMCAFASAEEPTDQWIEYHCPYNPRGDMNQSPSGSTTGGAAALAGYSWLDYSLGTDTTGSIRAPATCCGLYALRSSWGSASLEGIVKQCDLFDVIGIMSRELNTLHYLAKSALVVKEFASFPKRILYPTDFFPHSDPTQQAMVNELVITLENFLGVRKTEFSFAERWSQCPPSVAKGKSLKDFLSKSAFWVNYYDGYHEYDQFRDDYKRNFGKEVYVGPYMRFRWDAGANVTKDERDRGVSEFDVFREWVLENVMKADPAAGSDAILIMPCGNAKPKYRDMPNGYLFTIYNCRSL